jgi:hypothetical protein
MARSRNTADTQTASGGPVSPNIAGKNAIINGDFRIWQRGTSFSNPATGSFAADRWSVVWDGSGATRTVSQQAFTPGGAPVAGYEGAFFYRFAQSVAGSGGTYNLFQNRMEDVRTYAGQTVTISFWAKAASSMSLVRLNLEQDFGAGGSPSGAVSTDLANTNFSITTSWQRFTYTTTVPSISGKTIGTTHSGYMGLRFWLPVNSTFTLDVWGVQVELGSVATPFETATGTIQGELAACQRYFEKSIAQSLTPGASANSGEMWFPNGTIIPGETWQLVKFAVTKRVSPTITTYSYNGTTNRASDNNGTDYVANTADAWRTNDSAFVIKSSGASNMTVAAVRFVFCNWTASAEF